MSSLRLVTIACLLLASSLFASAAGSTANLNRHLSRGANIDLGPGWYEYRPRADLLAKIPALSTGTEITFHWQHTLDDWKSVAASVTQRVPVDYVPTERMLLSDPARLVVAGKAPDGAALIEVWELGMPEIVRTIDPVTGETVASLQPPAIGAVTEVYREQAAGREEVLALFRDQSSRDSSTLFVFFGGARDVYALDLATRTCSLAFSSTEPAPVPVQAELGYPHFDTFWARRHRDHGAVYVFGVEASSTSPTVVLRDRDANGTLDDSLVVRDFAQWEALGFAGDSDRWGE